MKKFNTSCIFTVNEEFHGNKTIKKIKKLMDVIIEIKSEDDNLLIRVPKIPSISPIEDWTKIKIN